MRTAVPLVVVLLLAGACSSVPPVAIRAGDICEGCRRQIQDTKIAAEIVDARGLAMKFRTVSCMARFACTSIGPRAGRCSSPTTRRAS